MPRSIRCSSIARQREFLAGRYAAKVAMSVFQGFSCTCQIGIGERKEPSFPAEFDGAISHSSDEAICAVRGSKLGEALGIDIEPIIEDGCDGAVTRRISNQSEILMLTNLGFGINEITTILLSAKESVFKCFSSLMQEGCQFNNIMLQRAEKNDNVSLLIFVVSNGETCHITSVEIQIRDETVYSLCRGLNKR